MESRMQGSDVLDPIEGQRRKKIPPATILGSPNDQSTLDQPFLQHRNSIPLLQLIVDPKARTDTQDVGLREVNLES